MNTDATTKRLLLAIALGLWANAAVQFVRPANMESDVRQIKGKVSDIELNVLDIELDVSSIELNVLDIGSEVSSIESEVSKIAYGVCLNPKIC